MNKAAMKQVLFFIPTVLGLYVIPTIVIAVAAALSVLGGASKMKPSPSEVP